MNFNLAINFLKDGHKLARKNWNGKGQYICLAHMDKCTLADGNIITDPCHINIGSNFIMFVGTSGYQCGWLASQADLLANDWFIVAEDEK